MATFQDIVPALGRGLDFAQNFVGDYDAIDLRRAAQVDRQEGAIEAGAYKVVQRSAGANMSVDVGANAGSFLVQGDVVTAQGLYYIPQLAAAVNLDIAASHATLPRIDQVLLEAVDDAHSGGGITRARVYVLTGTATAGATLDTRTGAGALPSSTARLADILVPAASTSVTTANIRDRRTWARGAHAILLGQNAFTYSTTSATFAEVDATLLKTRVELSGVPLILSAEVPVRSNVASGSQQMLVEFWSDGVKITDSRRALHNMGVSYEQLMSVRFPWAAPTAGSKVISLAFAMSGTGTFEIRGSTDTRVNVEIYEDLRPSASN